MVAYRHYARDRKGRFARTGTRSRTTKSTVKRKTTTRKTTTPRKRTPRKPPPKRIAAPKGAPKVAPYSARGVRSQMRGQRSADLAKLTGLKRSTVVKLTKQWKTGGVPKGLVKRVNDPSYRRRRNSQHLSKRGRVQRKK